MLTRRRWTVAALVALAAWGYPAEGSGSRERNRERGGRGAQSRVTDLDARVRTLVSTARVGTARVAVQITDLSTGRTLFSQNATEPMIPASNMKVLTTGAALETLGKDFLFRTEVLVDGERVVLRGGGDPALGDPVILGRMQPKMTVDQLVSMLAKAVPAAGVTKVSEVVVDDRIFDRQMVHPTWPKDQLDRWYCAAVSGVNFHANVLSFYAQPARAGAGSPPVITIEPEAPWLDLDNRARTAPGGKTALWIRRDETGGRYTVSGEVAAPIREAVEVTLADPAILAGQLLAAELPRAGVTVGPVPALPDGRVRLPRADVEAAVKTVRLAQSGEVLEGRVAAVVTTSLIDVINRCNADSQNMYAESLLKRVANEVTKEAGSWTGGSSVLRMTLAQLLGPEAAAGTVVADGSGMSRDNRVSARTLAKWLERMQGDPAYGAAFVASLAEPGEGTLRRRFQDAKLTGQVRAKSGLLAGVRCLSGYVTGPDNRRVAFSILINDIPRGESEHHARELTEDIVVAIDRFMATQREGR